MSKAKLWVGPVYLEPIEHKYHHRETGKIYKSVTTTLSSIEPHFDSEAVSLAITRQPDNVKQERYIGLNQQQILDFWQLLNDEANVYGTKVHDIVERYLLANKWYFPPENEDGEFEQKVIEGYENLKIDEGIAVWPERILFSEEYELAGMSDLIIDIDDVFFDTTASPATISATITISLRYFLSVISVMIGFLYFSCAKPSHSIPSKHFSKYFLLI
jgi:hypothetical protein